jgi:Xaa-Pro aminopeptidase
LQGFRAAHARDGVAVVRFLNWLEQNVHQGAVTEISAAQKLESLRMDTGQLKDISFDTISGAGANGAIVHYKVSEASNRPLRPNEIYLVDSGAQYEDGTTDITRTLCIGTPSLEMKRCYTLVLKGHIALSRAQFPIGTSGAQLDILARQPLWSHGLDYAHGTGHGVGHYLSVHEGPVSISKRSSLPLQVGMVLSNEPGYYKAGAFGIRIENLIAVKPVEDNEGWLGFETLTLAPYARNLIAPMLLDQSELDWINAYHARVENVIGPMLQSPSDRQWLQQQTMPL